MNTNAIWKGWFDGCCQPTNPGPAAIGIRLISPDGKVRDGGRPIGYRTNNEAEYIALICLLRKARKMGVQRLNIYGDSQLVIRQVTGEWSVNSQNLIPLHDMAIKLLREFQICELEWVRRSFNAAADRNASKALAQGSGIPAMA